MKNINDLLIKPTYSVSSSGVTKILPFGTDTVALQNISWSGLNELLQVASGAGDVDLKDFGFTLSNIDGIGIMNEGDGIRYSRLFDIVMDLTAWVYKIDITLCAALAVTAWTSGNHSIDSVRIIISEIDPDGVEIVGIDDRTIDTGMTTIGSAVNAAVIINYNLSKPAKLTLGNSLRIEITFNSTDTLVATSFEGVCPFFYFQEGATTKLLAESQIILHTMPALDQAFVVFRDQSAQDGLDYSGVKRWA